jgi:hypothetical protein
MMTGIGHPFGKIIRSYSPSFFRSPEILMNIEYTHKSSWQATIRVYPQEDRLAKYTE